MRTILMLVCFLLLTAGRATAAPLGTFQWTYDVLFGSGSTFTVTNESSDDFFKVFVDLYPPNESTASQTLSLGDIAAGGSSQSIDDLSLLLVPDDIARAILRLDFGTTLITTTLLASDLQGDATTLLVGTVDIKAVPEPPTLSLFGGAIAAWAARHLRRRRRPAALTDVRGAAH